MLYEPVLPFASTPIRALRQPVRLRLRVVGLSAPLVAVLASAALLSGCDWLGVESTSSLVARKEAEGRALGAACRQAARGIEDCFVQYKRADKAALFVGWREMNDYMRENKMEAAAQSAAQTVTQTATQAAAAQPLR